MIIYWFALRPQLFFESLLTDEEKLGSCLGKTTAHEMFSIS